MPEFPARLLSLALASLLIACPAGAQAASFFDNFADPKDGKFDASQWLAGKSGFLPVPLVISEPAVGYGAGLAVAFLHDPKEEKPQSDDPNAMLHLPPSISFAAGAVTENDSWLLAGGHVASWKQDSMRYTGIVGYGDLKLKFYGIDPNFNRGNIGLNFDIRGLFLLQELIYRIGPSDFFLGARYSFLGSEVDFTGIAGIPLPPVIQFDSKTAGFGVIAKYDTRNSIVTPDSGHYARLEPMFYSKALGGDFEYNKIRLSSFSYWPLSDVVLGLRLQGDFSNGDVPFYDVPYIEMRGIPALRYQGEDVIVAEIEARWDVNFRWSLVGFVGKGWTGDSIGGIDNDDSAGAGGAGFRYLLARRYGLRAGVDVARGPEDSVVYLTVGSNWN